MSAILLDGLRENLSGLDGLMKRMIQPNKCEDQAGGDRGKSGESSEDSGWTSQLPESFASAVGEQPGPESGGEVARDHRPREAGNGGTRLDKRAILLGQRWVRLDRPFDRQPIGRIELIIEIRRK